MAQISSRLLWMIVLGLLALQSACSLRQGIPVGQIPVPQQVSPSDKQSSLAMVDQYASQSGYKVVKDKKTERRIQGMVDKMAKAAGASGYSYPVVILDAGDEVNAAAVNGATILVHTSLLEKLKNDDELAVVIGHEIAHIAAKHHADDGEEDRATAVSVGSSLAGLAVSIGASVAGAGSGAASLAGDVTEGVTGVVGEGALVKAYSRDMETEADHVGIMIMAKAGYDPRAALEVWGRAEEIFGSADGSDFFSTHPSSGNRLEDLQAAMPKALEYYEQSKASATPAKPSGKKKK